MKTCDVNGARSHVLRSLHIHVHLGKMVVEISQSTYVKTKISSKVFNGTYFYYILNSYQQHSELHGIQATQGPGVAL